MAAITKIEFWSDVGFIDGAVEIPRLNAADPTNPDMVIEPDDPIMPSKDRFFSELKLKEYYTGLLTMSYMRIRYDLKNSLGIDTPNIFYGWIDKVELSSDGEYPMTIISWHIDEWRTWKAEITFGSGHVKRRPFKDLATTPIQDYPIRYVKLDSDDIHVHDILLGNDGFNNYQVWWILVSVNHKTVTDEIETRFYTYPIFLTMSTIVCHFKATDVSDNTVKTLHGPRLDQIYEGYLDERLGDMLGAAPESVNGVWITPISPILSADAAVSGTGSHGSPFDFGNMSSDCVDGSYGMLKLAQVDFIRSRSKTITAITSSEEKRYCLTSTDGLKILDLPYGYSVDTVNITMLNEPDGPYFEISLKNSTYGNLEGMTVNVPLLSLPFSSNAYTSYVYSGQQQYDKEMRTLRSNSKAIEGTSVMAASGALMGAFGSMGAIAGAGMGLASGLLPYASEMIYSNDKEQTLENRLKANQPSTMIISPNALLSIARGYDFVIKALIPDDYSAAPITAMKNQFGVSVDELNPSCDTLIRVTSPTGYYNIQNMIVNGNVPVSAKKWIREKFRSGVRLV